MAEVNVPKKIIKVGGSEETHRRLENMGFVPGSEVTVISKINGNLILKIKDSRVAVDGKLANHIMIS